MRDKSKINAVGLWSMRIALVVGAVVAGCLGKEEVAGACIVGLICSFLFLDSDE